MLCYYKLRWNLVVKELCGCKKPYRYSRFSLPIMILPGSKYSTGEGGMLKWLVF